MARAIKLIDAPIGLFEVDGILVLKTEYSTRHEDGTITPDCYIIESGKYFWGGVDSVEERNNLEVAPVDMPTLTPPNEWVSVENALPPNMDDVLVVVQNNGERWTVTGYYSNTSNVWYAMLNGQDTQMDVLWWMPLPAPPDRRPPEGEEDA